jgi:hypothetical protein
LRLPDVHSTWAFEIYMDWSYTNILTVDDIVSRATRISSISALIEFYLLGDVLDDETFFGHPIVIRVFHGGPAPIPTQIVRLTQKVKIRVQTCNKDVKS